MSLGSMKFEVNSDTGFVTVGYGAGSSPTFTRVLVGDGTAAAPSYSFINDSTTGFYRLSGNQIGISINGVHAGNFWSTGANSIRFAGAANNFFECSNNGWIQIVAAGTNQNIYITPSGSGWVALPNNSNSQLGLTFGQAVSNASNYFNSGNGAGWVMHFTTGSASYNSSNVRLTITDSNLWTPSSINLLLGTNVDSANGRLQLANHTAITGGIGFGTDTTVYRTAANSLGIYTNSQHSFTFNQNGANSVFTFNTFPGIIVNCTRIQAQFGTDLFVGGFGGSNENTVLRVGGTGQVLLTSSTGPAISSAITGRGSRQALLFDGTKGVTIPTSVCAFGTGDFTIAFIARRDTAALQQYLLGNDIGQCLFIGFRVSGFLYSGQAGGTSNADFDLKNVVGKEQHIVLTRAGTTLTCYSNGVSVGTVTDSRNYSAGAATLFAADSTGSAALVGSGSLQGVYNRALSATEVVELYESGAPAQEDYGVSNSVPPSNTGLVGDAFSNFQYDTFTGATASGFTAVETGGQACQATTGKTTGTYLGLAPVGTRYLVTFTATLTSGAGPVVAIGKSTVGLASNIAVVVNGANSHVLTTTVALTAENSANSGNLYFTSTGNTNYTISGFTVIRLGLLIAPSDSQSGGGLTWYDTSGNGRNITLPATGVSWNVPTSGYYTTTGALNITGGANLILTASTGNLYLRSTTGGAIFDTGAYFLFGTATNSSNGIIQLATHTTIAGGIGFGTDLAIFRSGIGTFHFQTTAGNIGILLGDTGYTMQLGSRLVSSNGELTVQTSNANSLFLKTGGVTALTIDSSLNSTFAGTAITLASATAKAGLRLPHGAAPTAPVNGDIWTTTAGLYVRINGVTVGPLT